MALVELNWKPSDRQLRQFGVISLLALPALAWFWGGGPQAIGWAGVAGVVLATIGWVAPQQLKYPFIGLSLLSWPIGLVMGELVMLAVYFGLFLIFGLWFRLQGRDVLKRRLDRDSTTYWEDRAPQRPAQDYYRQS